MIFVIFAFCILKVFGNNNDLIDASKWAVEGSWPPPEANIDNDIISRLIELRSGFEKVLLVQNSTSQVKTPENNLQNSINTEPNPTSAAPSAASPPEIHHIKVIIAVDNSYILTVNGETVSPGSEEFWIIRSHTFTVSGVGPWLVAVEGLNTGVRAGFLGAVFVDDILKVGTGIPGLQTFKSFDRPSPGWNQSITFDDSRWSNSVECIISPGDWGVWIPDFNREAKRTFKPMWHKSCDNQSTRGYFRALVSA